MMRASPKSPIQYQVFSVDKQVGGFEVAVQHVGGVDVLRPLRSWYMNSLAWPSDRRPSPAADTGENKDGGRRHVTPFHCSY
ncbi:hypothetical protein INR49_020490 [Caranx melampygus]|nr:hypothetical protein INR49_020490 [Caranx melampygus]